MCGNRRRRLASCTAFCYLCCTEGDAERARRLRPGRLAQSPRRLQALAASAVPADDGVQGTIAHLDSLRSFFCHTRRITMQGVAMAALECAGHTSHYDKSRKIVALSCREKCAQFGRAAYPHGIHKQYQGVVCNKRAPGRLSKARKIACFHRVRPKWACADLRSTMTALKLGAPRLASCWTTRNAPVDEFERPR